MRFLRFLFGTLAAAALVLAVVDLATASMFPHLSRLGPDFSAAYLNRVARQDRTSSKILVLGDSVLWGYRLDPDQSAASILDRAGWPIENLSYEGGSVPNTYALLRFLLSKGVRPRAVIFNVNLKEFNVNDSAYQKLHPAVEALAWPLLSDADRNNLVSTNPQTLDARIDRALGSVWFLYGARSDIRDYLFHDRSDAATVVRDAVAAISGTAARDAALHRPTADKFIGTYDLTELSSENVGVYFLKELADLLAESHIPAYAILTPTNHTLLHDFIDGPEYAAQLAYVAHILKGRGIAVLNYDRSFDAASFIDNDHLTAQANQELTTKIERDVRL